MPRIFDNENYEQALFNRLKSSLKSASRADFCVGYFNIAAWDKIIQPYVEEFSGGEKACCRLLVGMQPSAMDVVDKAVEIESDTPDSLKRLRNQIEAKKVFIKRGGSSLIHAKLYIIHGNDVSPPLCIVGSSNLTLPGLKDRTELNVEFLDHDACKKFQEWFNQQWDKREDVSELVIRRIDQCLRLEYGCS